jgi:hypothetical protein
MRKAGKNDWIDSSSQAIGPELAKTPVVFGYELLDHVTRSDFFWQHFPGVGLHLEMPTPTRLVSKQLENSGNVIARICEKGFRLRMNRNMEMHAPLITGIVSIPFEPLNRIR